NLKKIGDRIGLRIPLTTYVARHSWASIARNMDVSIAVISEGMGHNSYRTTQIYLNSIDTSQINRANWKIIRSVRRKC
ncbi:tyrosine-type recombinase/integrase, partial [Segatella asaccharophila]